MDDVISIIANNVGAVLATALFLYILKDVLKILKNQTDQHRLTTEKFNDTVSSVSDKFNTTIQVYLKEHAIVVNNLSLKLQEFTKSQIELRDVIKKLYKELMLKSKKINKYEKDNN